MTSASGIDGLPSGWSVEWLDETGSTNADGADAARLGAAEGRVVATGNQTAGRGRLDRAWVTPPGVALSMSVVLRPDGHGLPPDRWTAMPLVAGIAVVQALRELGASRVGLKWPNDVLAVTTEGERKLCGILVEVVDGALVVGIGVNVAQTADQLAIPTATSLRLLGVETSLGTVLSAVARHLADAYVDWLREPGWLLPRYTEVSMTLGRPVRAELPGGDVLRGGALSIDEVGRLTLLTPEGARVVQAGDVVHLRMED